MYMIYYTCIANFPSLSTIVAVSKTKSNKKSSPPRTRRPRSKGRSRTTPAPPQRYARSPVAATPPKPSRQRCHNCVVLKKRCTTRGLQKGLLHLYIYIFILNKLRVTHHGPRRHARRGRCRFDFRRRRAGRFGVGRPRHSRGKPRNTAHARREKRIQNTQRIFSFKKKKM